LVLWLLKLGQYDDGFLVAITTDKRPCYNRTFHTSNQLDCSIRVGLWWLYGAYHRFTHYICSHRVSLTSSQRVEGFSSTRGYCLLSYKTTAFVPATPGLCATFSRFCTTKECVLCCSEETSCSSSRGSRRTTGFTKKTELRLVCDARCRSGGAQKVDARGWFTTLRGLQVLGDLVCRRAPRRIVVLSPAGSRVVTDTPSHFFNGYGVGTR